VAVEFRGAAATVYEGDALLGDVPLVLRRAPGTVMELQFKAEGFKDLPMKVRFESDAVVQVRLEKRPAAARPAKGTGTDSLDLKTVPWMERR
jgi:hypothetical protein